MILVTLGTVSFPFNRLAEEVIRLLRNKKENVIFQSGNYYKNLTLAPNLTIKQYISFNKMLNLYKRADLIISACGETSVFLILSYSKNIPIFVPRLKKFNEHVDDQQLMIAKHIEKTYRVYCVYDIKQLESYINKARQPNKNFLLNSGNKELENLIKNLDGATREFLKKERR